MCRNAQLSETAYKAVNSNGMDTPNQPKKRNSRSCKIQLMDASRRKHSIQCRKVLKDYNLYSDSRSFLSPDKVWPSVFAIFLSNAQMARLGKIGLRRQIEREGIKFVIVVATV